MHLFKYRHRNREPSRPIACGNFGWPAPDQRTTPKPWVRLDVSKGATAAGRECRQPSQPTAVATRSTGSAPLSEEVAQPLCSDLVVRVEVDYLPERLLCSIERSDRLEGASESIHGDGVLRSECQD